MDSLINNDHSNNNTLIFLTNYFPEYIDTVANDTILIQDLIKLTEYSPPIIIDTVAIATNDTLSHEDIISFLHNL